MVFFSWIRYPVILHLVNFNERSISSEGQHIIASEILKIFGKNFFVLNSESTDNDNEKHLKNYPSSSLQNESVRREDIKESSVLMKLCDIDRNSIKSTSKSSTLDCEMSKNDDDDGPIMITPKQNQSFETSKLELQSQSSPKSLESTTPITSNKFHYCLMFDRKFFSYKDQNQSDRIIPRFIANKNNNWIEIKPNQLHNKIIVTVCITFSFYLF